MNKILLFFFPFLSIFFNGCVGGNPKKDEIIGIWKNIDGALFRFKKDGTFDAKNLSVKLFKLDDDFKLKKFDCNGKWELIEGDGRQFGEIDLIFDTVSNHKNGYEYERTILVSGQNGILENSPPWYLFVWVGEEGGERYVFKRQ